MFTKSDLKTGDVIKRRDGSVQIVIKEFDVLVSRDGWDDLRDITETLDFCSPNLGTDRNYDIVEVRRPNYKYEVQFAAFLHGWGTIVYERREILDIDEQENNIPVIDEELYSSNEVTNFLEGWSVTDG